MESNFDSSSESRLSLIKSSNTPYPDLSCWRGSHTVGLGTPTPSNGFNFIEGNEITDPTYLNQLWIVLNDQVKQLDQENIILKDKLGIIASIVSPYFDTQHYLLSFRPLQESHQLVSCDPMVSKLTEIGNSWILKEILCSIKQMQASMVIKAIHPSLIYSSSQKKINNRMNRFWLKRLTK